jgi:hypothetical protein
MLIRRLFVQVSLPGWKGSLALGADEVDFTIPDWKCARLLVNVGHVHALFTNFNPSSLTTWICFDFRIFKRPTVMID